MVGGVRDVDGDRHGRTQAPGSDQGTAAVEADLLLRRGDSGHGRQARAVRITTERLEDDERADPVIDGARSHAIPRQLDDPGIDHPRIADTKPCLGIGTSRDADIDPQILELHRLFAVLALDEVDRLATNHAEHVAFASRETDTLTDQDLRIPAADRADPHETLVVDPGDDDPDLVDVSGEHDGDGCALVGDGDTVAGDIARDVGHLACLIAPDGGRLGLEATGPGRIEKLFEKCDGSG
jgi:hypothetical protein